MTMQRSLLRFYNAIKSEATKNRYEYRLTKFLEFVKLKEHDDLLQLKESYLQEIVEDYLFYLKKSVSPNSIPSYMAPLELFFAMNDKNLNWKKMKKMYPAVVKRTGSEAYSTKDVTQMLRQTRSKRQIAMIYFLASSGCRVGVLTDLRLKHLIEMEDCKAFHIYEGSNEEYWSFLTPEASNALAEYLNERKKDGELIVPESPLFRSAYTIGSAKARPMAYKTVLMQMWRTVKASVDRVKVGTVRYNKQMDHAFRKRFDTILKDNKEGNIALKEKLMGHKGVFKLDGTYHVPELRVLFEEFKIHIPNLTIDESERLRLQNKSQDEIIKKIESEKDMLIMRLSEQIKENETTKKNVSRILKHLKLDD